MKRLLAVAFSIGIAACNSSGGTVQPSSSSGSSIHELMQARGLTEDDVQAALKTYVPGGKHDDYMLFASGGHGGQVIAMGVPSMRIIKVIGVFTPEPWQGFGYGGEANKIIEEGYQDGRKLTWADTHHPNLSETKGDYDGKFLFINDKANARIGVIDLEDFVTKQIVTNPLIASDHGGAFVDPNTNYIIETSQYPAPLGRGYAPISEYKDKYRGLMTFWKFDREKGRVDVAKSWSVELPPYTQDLADAGKLGSDGFAFVNSFNTELATGGILKGDGPTKIEDRGVPIESGASQNDMDYLHIVNWKKAEQLVAAGKGTVIKGMRVLPIELVAAEGVLTLVGEPKSPHGCDVTPDGKYVVIGGKLDTHTTLYDIQKMKDLIDKKQFEGKDAYGVPILAYKDALHGQVELGLGPLHTVFDDKGNAYTSLFIESVVAKWSIPELKLIEKLPVHYNIGHIAAAEGDTVSPDGHYVVALNKMAIDRFAEVGPLKPQNFQLVDISGPQMKLLYDAPIPIGEPHYAQIIKMDKLHPRIIYPLGTNPLTGERDPKAVDAGQERIERHGNVVDVYMTAIRSHFTPDRVEVNEGDTVNFHITNIEQSDDQTHGFSLNFHNINLSLEPGKHENFTVKVDRPGVYPFYCTEFCSALHLEMVGYMLVKPKDI